MKFSKLMLASVYLFTGGGFSYKQFRLKSTFSVCHRAFLANSTECHFQTKAAMDIKILATSRATSTLLW